jgi:hypothetical protein
MGRRVKAMRSQSTLIGMTTNRLGIWTSSARVAAVGLVILAAGLILSSGSALAAVGERR